MEHDPGGGGVRGEEPPLPDDGKILKFFSKFSSKNLIFINFFEVLYKAAQPRKREEKKNSLILFRNKTTDI